MPSASRWPERGLAPLDRLRGAFLGRLGPVAAPWLRDRSARVALIAVGSLSLALCLALWAPLAALSLTPLVLGVPHLLGDVRYLVVRQGLHRRRLLMLGLLPCFVMLVRDGHLGWGAVAVAVAAVSARGPGIARMGVVLACGGLTVLAECFGHAASVVFAHVHNLVALGIWLLWARSRRVFGWVALAVCAVALVLATGAFDPMLAASVAHADPVRVEPGALESSLTLTRDPVWSLRWLSFFAFAQSLHYAVWLKLVPEEDRERPFVRSFVASYRALVRDLGSALPIAGAALTMLLCLAATRDVSWSRDSYLRFAAFHGPLELAVLVLLALERRAPMREAARAT